MDNPIFDELHFDTRISGSPGDIVSTMQVLLAWAQKGSATPPVAAAARDLLATISPAFGALADMLAEVGPEALNEVDGLTFQEGITHLAETFGVSPEDQAAQDPVIAVKAITRAARSESRRLH